MTYEEWRKLAVCTTDLRVIPTVGDQWEYCDESVSGVAFMQRVCRSDIPDCTERFDNLGVIYQHDGLWQVDICQCSKEFASFEDSARYLWKEWVQPECFPYLDWERPIAWDTGEELIVLDGPSPDGGLEVRAPREYAMAYREGSCLIDNKTGLIATPDASDFPRVVNR